MKVAKLNKLVKDAELDSIDLIHRRDQAIRDKRNYQTTLESVAPYRIKLDAKVQLKLCELRINEMNDELSKRALSLRDRNKIKGADIAHGS